MALLVCLYRSITNAHVAVIDKMINQLSESQSQIRNIYLYSGGLSQITCIRWLVVDDSYAVCVMALNDSGGPEGYE